MVKISFFGNPRELLLYSESPTSKTQVMEKISKSKTFTEWTFLIRKVDKTRSRPSAVKSWFWWIGEKVQNFQKSIFRWKSIFQLETRKTDDLAMLWSQRTYHSNILVKIYHIRYIKITWDKKKAREGWPGPAFSPPSLDILSCYFIFQIMYFEEYIRMICFLSM
jgi:hypothetical protein